MNFEVENQILVQENSRIHKENCYLQHFNSDLTSKLNEFRCKVENLLVELNEIPQGFRLNDAFKIKESEVFGDENYLDDFMVVVEDEIKDNPHLENECIKGSPRRLSSNISGAGDTPGGFEGLPSPSLYIDNPDEDDEGNSGDIRGLPAKDCDIEDDPGTLEDSINLLDTSVNVEVTMSEEFPAFRKDLLSSEENIQIKTETDSNEVEETQDSETKVSFPCTKCKYVGETFEDLNKHTRRNHILGNVEKNAEGLFKCKSCNYAVNTRGKLLVHVQKHEGKVHRCSQCLYTSACEAYLKIHVVRTHGERRFQCDKCEYSTKDKSRLKSHVKYRHDKVKRELKYTCDICGFKTHTNSYLKKHKQTHDGIMIYCDQCPYSTPSEHNMKYHTSRTHCDLIFSCDKCTFSSKVKHRLKVHMNSVHGDEKKELRYSCDKCDYKTHTDNHLTKHKQTHDGVMQSCDQCTYSTRSEYNMKYHKNRTHSVLTFSCEKCPFSSKIKHNLKIHMKTIHDQGKIVSVGKHKCDICDKSFSSPTYLKRHKESHYCDLCEYFDSSSHNLKKHKAEVHIKTEIKATS